MQAHLRENPTDADAYLQQGLVLRALDENAAAGESFERSCKFGNPAGCAESRGSH